MELSNFTLKSLFRDLSKEGPKFIVSNSSFIFHALLNIDDNEKKKYFEIMGLNPINFNRPYYVKEMKENKDKTKRELYYMQPIAVEYMQPIVVEDMQPIVVEDDHINDDFTRGGILGFPPWKKYGGPFLREVILPREEYLQYEVDRYEEVGQDWPVTEFDKYSGISFEYQYREYWSAYGYIPEDNKQKLADEESLENKIDYLDKDSSTYEEEKLELEQLYSTKKKSFGMYLWDVIENSPDLLSIQRLTASKAGITSFEPVNFTTTFPDPKNRIGYQHENDPDFPPSAISMFPLYGEKEVQIMYEGFPKYLANLVELNLSYNKLKNLAGIITLIYLVKLDLTGNQIDDLTDLDKLPNLITLILNDNNMTKLPLFSVCPLNIVTLSLVKNNLTDLIGFPGLPKLKHLDLRDNKLTKELIPSSIQNIPNLEIII